MKAQNEEIIKSLISFGLSEKEASVYYSALELGRATVTEISRKAGIHRTTGYSILNSLVAKGLVNISGKEPKQEYLAETPDIILERLREEQKKIEKNIEHAEKFLPTLRSIQKIEDRPQIKFYEGIEGLKSVYEDTLTAKEQIVAYAAYEDMHATLKDYFPAYYKRRAAAGVTIKGIVPQSPMALERKKLNREESREFAMIPKDLFDISPEIDIYDNKVMIASWREKLGIIIESKEIADAMKKIFALAWKEAVRLEKESENN